MAVRHEKVILSLQDDFTSGMARAAASTALLNKELNSLSGSAVRSQRSVTALGKSDGLPTLGRTADTSGKQIDKLSGRLALLAQAAAVLGPALVPIGAAAIPAIAGMTAQLGAVVGAAGVAALAFNGLGDGLKALNAYQLEPTAENLAKMRLEMEKLGPDGAHFVRFIDSLQPQIRGLQMTARAGLFPGMEDGITSLLDLLPQVNRIVGEIAGAMGSLSSSAGASLAGPRFREFFDYLESEARPLLIELGHTVGNFADGFTSMMVAFGPLSSDFSGGLENMSAAFAEWAHGLDSSDSFASFLDYIESNGPRVLDMLGSLAGLFASIVEAAAPVGAAVVPALTALLKVMTALVDSPIGSVMVAAAAGLSVYSRAAVMAEKASVKMGIAGATGLARFNAISSAAKNAGAGIGMIALSMTDLDDKAGVSNTAMLTLAGSMAGPWGAAAGAAVGLTMDLAAANDGLEAATSRANRAIEMGARPEQRAAYTALRDEIAAADGPVRSVGDAFMALTSKLGFVTRAEHDAAFAAGELRTAMGQTGDVGSLLAGPLGMTEAQLDAIGTSAERASKWLANLNGVLDVRASWTNYHRALDAVNEALQQNGRTVSLNTAKGQANRDVIDNIGHSIAAVAEHMKGANKLRFLDRARGDFIDSANKLGMNRKEARGLADDLGVVSKKRVQPKIDVDTKRAKGKIDDANDWINRWGSTSKSAKVDANTQGARSGIHTVEGDLAGLLKRPATVRVTAETGAALSALATARAQLNAMNGLTATTYIRTVRTGPGGTGDDLRGYASGGYTGAGGRDEVAGVVHRGEVVIPQEDVKRDWSMLKSRYGHLPGFADGGLAGSADRRRRGDRGEDDTSRALHRFKGALERAKKALDSETNKRQELLSKRNEVSGSIKDGLRTDLFAAPENPWAKGSAGGVNGTLKSDIGQAKHFTRLIRELKSKGLDGPALMEIIATGDIERAQLYADMSRKGLNRFENLYEQRDKALRQAGLTGGNAVFGKDIRETTREIRHLRADVKRLEHAVKHHGPKATGHEVSKAINDGASKGAGRGRR